MDWDNYSSKFRAAALSANFDDKYVERCLGYAKRLDDRGLPIVYSAEHLAALSGFDESYLRFVSYKPERFYRRFSIAKKSGGSRSIAEPLPNLKAIQRWILENILQALEPSPYAKAFVKKRSIKENARFHRRQEGVLTLDIKDFFPCLSTAIVGKYFRSLGYSRKVAYCLTRLCTLDGGLPQGAPTSPCLSNLLFARSDMVIGEYCKQRSIRYTRYADDMTFSGTFASGELIRFVRRAIARCGLHLNEDKTRLMRRHQRQEVTGIVVNETLQVPRSVRRNLRQAIHYIDRFGLDYHLGRIGEFRANYAWHLRGLCAHILFINPKDRDAIRALTVLSSNSAS